MTWVFARRERRKTEGCSRPVWSQEAPEIRLQLWVTISVQQETTMENLLLKPGKCRIFSRENADYRKARLVLKLPQEKRVQMRLFKFIYVSAKTQEKKKRL